MKLTTKRLKQLIKEELSNVLQEKERSYQQLVKLIDSIKNMPPDMDPNPEITMRQLKDAEEELARRFPDGQPRGYNSGDYDEMEKMYHGRNANRPMEE